MSVRHIIRVSAPIAALTAFAATPAFAHPGHDHFGFIAGLAHPMSGLDHVLAMVAVGLLAAVLGGSARWLVPTSFLGAMMLGGALGVSGASLPFAEVAILASVVVLGAAAAFGRGMPMAAAMALSAAFAVFHGYAHGAEMPAAASALSYGLGFVSATALLHAVGLGGGLAADRITQSAGHAVVRVGGGAIAALGLVLFLV